MKGKKIKRLILIIALILFVMGCIPFVNSFLRKNIGYNLYLCLIFLGFVTIGQLILYLIMKGNFRKINNNLSRIDGTYKKIKKEKMSISNNYFREIPFKGDLFRMFWIAWQFGVIDNEANILNALILKWYDEGRIDFKSNDEYIINEERKFTSENEKNLFELLKNNDKNGFKKLTMLNSKDILRVVDKILLDETNKLRCEGKVIDNNGELVISKRMQSDIDVVVGFKKFLLDFSRIDDKTIEEVNLWKEYLICAELLGISEQVKKQLDVAEINYSSFGLRLKRINTGTVTFITFLSFVSYAFYGLIFFVFSIPIAYLYALITWNI